jgi:23S rRNA (cytosine1962-C5)-methyltransferase
MTLPKIILKPGKERSLKRAHPWIFSGAISEAPADLASGATVLVASAEGSPLAIASFSPHSQIRARILSFDTRQSIDAPFFRGRLEQALQRRQRLFKQSRVYRLVHGEADGLPGLIVDRYNDVLVAQFLSAGAEAHKSALVQAMLETLAPRAVYERSDADTRHLEGLPSITGLLYGDLEDGPIEIEEHGLRYAVDVRLGHKTGFYLDQRDNRKLLSGLAGARVLNCFCYTGGFSLAARSAGANQITSIDASQEALDLARRNWQLNRFDDQGVEWRQADVFASLRELRDEHRQFDTIVLDPPKFAPTAGHVEKAARAYKDINLLGLKLLAPGGTMLTFSCSGGVSADLFQKIVAGAAADALAAVTIEQRLCASADHPVLMSFPEGEYLKGLVLTRTSDK